jgi:hypothetical protein
MLFRAVRVGDIEVAPYQRLSPATASRNNEITKEHTCLFDRLEPVGFIRDLRLVGHHREPGTEHLSDLLGWRVLY